MMFLWLALGAFVFVGLTFALQILSQRSDYKHHHRVGESYDAFCHRSYSRYM